MAASQRGLQTGLKSRKRTVILFADSIIINEVPPLRAVWAPIGTQAEVPIVAARDRQVLTGVLNMQSGASLLCVTARYTQAEFQMVLQMIRRQWRGWQIVLFVDKHSAHRARASRRLARQLGITIRWLPKACPELNPVDHLWRHVTNDILANEPTPTLDATVERACQYWLGLTPRQRLRKAGVLSDNFWLAALRR